MKSLTMRTGLVSLIGLVTLIGGPWYVLTHQKNVEVRVTTSDVKKCPVVSLTEQYEIADVILEATVMMVVPGETYAEVFLSSGRVYKGTFDRPQRILATPVNPIGPSPNRQYRQVEINGRRQDEISFATGQAPYLLFLRKTDDGYLTSRCDGSRLLGDGLTEAEKIALGVVQ